MQVCKSTNETVRCSKKVNDNGVHVTGSCAEHYGYTGAGNRVTWLALPHFHLGDMACYCGEGVDAQPKAPAAAPCGCEGDAKCVRHDYSTVIHVVHAPESSLVQVTMNEDQFLRVFGDQTETSEENWLRCLEESSYTLPELQPPQLGAARNLGLYLEWKLRCAENETDAVDYRQGAIMF